MPAASSTETLAKYVVQGASTLEEPLSPVAAPTAPEVHPKRRMRRPGVGPADLLSEAGRKILSSQFEEMIAKEAGAVAGEDPEELHAMRVATRRQRAALRIVGPYFRRKAIEPVRKGLRSLGGVLGAVRDLDVLLDAAGAYRSTLPAEEARALEVLVDSWTRRRDAARVQMLGHLDGKAYADFKVEYARFLGTPGAGARSLMAGKIPRPTLVAHVIAVDIWAHYASVSAFGAVLPCASVETLHALRTECKGLRYLLEFFGEALDPCIEEAIEAIVAVQDHLGELQDAIVTIEFVRAFLAEPAAVASHEVTTAARRYLESRQSRIENLRSCVDRPWMGVSDRGFKACLARATASL